MTENGIKYRALRKAAGLFNKHRQGLKHRVVRTTANTVFGEDVEAKLLSRMVRMRQPSKTHTGVCFFAPHPQNFMSQHKVSAIEFLPRFCDVLRENQVCTFFATSLPALSRSIQCTDRSIVVCIYGEREIESGPALLDILDTADLVFNSPRSGAVIWQKPRTNSILTKVGCRVPKKAQDLDDTDLVFSNAASGSGRPTYLINKIEGLNEIRHNTEFIDTRRTHRDCEFYTTMRLMCINERITHCFMRLRSTDEGDPGVHAKDTPLSTDIINTIWKTTLDSAEDQFKDIANKVYEAFGPGFYSHDTLVDSRTGQAFICETGYKFNDMAYQRHLERVADQVTGIKGFETPRNAGVSSASIFLDIITRSLEHARESPL